MPLLDFKEKHKTLVGFVGVMVGIFGTTLLFKDLILNRTYESLWATHLDSRLIFWITNWGYHILFEEFNPGNFWNANSFYPHLNTLAYSDSLLSLQILFAPLRTLNVPPMLALYLSLAVVCVIACGLSYFALTRIGYFSTLEKALIVFCSHFSLAMISYFNHYQLFGFQLAIPFFLFLYLYLRDFRIRDLIAACALYIVGVSFAVYLAPILTLFSVFLAIPMLIIRIRAGGLRNTLAKIGALGVAIVLVSGLVLYVIQIKPYLDIADSYSAQTFEETRQYSANVDTLFRGHSSYSTWYTQEDESNGQWERAYFPGYVLLSALVVGIALWIVDMAKKLIYGNKTRDDDTTVQHDYPRRPVESEFVLYQIILFILCIIFSYGPYLRWSSQLITDVKMPYYWVASVIPWLANVRAPGRMGMFIGLPMSVFLIVVVRRLKLGLSKRTLVMVVLFALIIIESIPTFPVYAFSHVPTDVYQKLNEYDIKDTPIIELPVQGATHIETTFIALNQLAGSTFHWGKLFVGYGARTTPEYEKLIELDNALQVHGARKGKLIDFAQRYGVSHFLIHLDKYDPEIREIWRSFSVSDNNCVIFEHNDTIFFEIGSDSCE